MANKTNGTVNYYCYDPHGSVVSIGGKTYTYDAFGNQTNDNADDTNPFRYCGEYFDNETGYIYLRARYYDPSIGRFTTEDPIKDGLNWYVYCSNNPVGFVDPSGLFDYDTKLSYNPNEYNEDVVALQNELAYLGYLSKDDRDGYFGQKTLDAVNTYKNDRGLWNFGECAGIVGLTTWESLGLKYRTQEDIDRGLQITLVGHAQYFDVSKMFNDQLWAAEQYLEKLGSVERYSAWYNKVNHNGDWDIKVRESWDKTFGGSYPGNYDTPVVLYGNFSTPEEMGNIFYGYTGSVIQLPEEVLIAGSVYAAGTGGTLNSFTGVKSEFSDWASISQGVFWYSYKHPVEKVIDTLLK